MSQSVRKVYERKQVITNRSGSSSSNQNIMYSQSQARNGNNIQYSIERQYTPIIPIDNNDGFIGNGLQWQGIMNKIVYQNDSDIEQLKKHKNIILDLIKQFESSSVVIRGEQRDKFSKRLILLQNEMEGLLRRKILYNAPDHKGGKRQLDYTGLLNQKENQIIQLQKKIQNLQQRMRRMQARQVQLQNQIVILHQQLKRKNQIIQHKDHALSHQVAFSAQMASIIQKIKRSGVSKNILVDLVIPTLEISDIRAASKRVADSRSSNVQAIKIIREFQNSGSRQNSRLNVEAIIQGWIMGLPRDSPLRIKLSEGQKRAVQDRRYVQMQQKFSLAGQIYRQQIEKLRQKNPGLRFDIDDQIFGILGSAGTSVARVNNVIQIQKTVEKTIQVPVQDARTKHLIHLLASNYKKMFTKYPKLYDEMDSRLAQFFSQQIIDIMQVDEFDRIVQVIKYVPQVVKVENVYAYSSQKSKKVQFHLRVLIKALLEEMQKIKRKHGIVADIDQGIIGMIRQQIMDLVDVDDILKVYRVTPKIVEVQKIVEKVVQRIVQVPKIVQVERRIQVPVQVDKYQIVQNTVNVPVEVPKIQTLIVQKLVPVPRIQQKIVEVPTIVQKVVEVEKVIRQVQPVQMIVQKLIPGPKQIVYVPQQKIVYVPQYRDVELIKQKIVQVQKPVPTPPVPVQVIVQKIIPLKQQVIKMVQVQKIVQKIVQRVEYVPAPDIRNHIEIRYQPVDRIIEKVVPIIQTVQRIVQVPKVIQKIVEVHDLIEKIKPVQYIVQKVVYKDRIKQVQIIKQVVVQKIVEVPKIVDKVCQVPVIHEVIKIQKQIIQKPVIQTVKQVIHQQVKIKQPHIMYQDRIKQVEKIVHVPVKQPQIVQIYQEKIIPVQRVIQRIKVQPIIIEKIIEKMVEVPKVVEVQKIVQKVVVVPRIIQKIVEVPQIVQKIIEKVNIIPQIVQIQKRVQVPVFQERIVQRQVPRNVYLQVQRPKQVIRQVMVKDKQHKDNTVFHQIISQKVVVQHQPRIQNIQVEKIVFQQIVKPKIIHTKQQVIVPVEIPIPFDRVVQKPVEVQRVIPEVHQVDKITQKIVAIKTDQIQVVQIQKHVDNIVIQQRVKQVQRVVPYINEKIKEIPVLRQKPVVVQKIVQDIKVVQQFIQKVVNNVITVPQILTVQRLQQVRVDVPKIVQIQKVVNQIIQVPKIVDRIVQKIVQLPMLIQKLKQIQVERQKVVQVKTLQTQVHQVDRFIQKQVIVQKLLEVTKNVHLIEQTLQIVDRIIQKNLDPVLITEQRVLQVPQIIQKIVQKIVVMPQIVQVLKYVHEIAQQQTLGVAVNAQIGIEQRKYKELAGNVKGQLQILIVQLRRLRTSNPNLRVTIQLIQKFLAQFQSFILYPRIHQIVKTQQVQKVVQKNRPVLVPVQDQSHLRLQLAKTILIQKLIAQLKLIKKQNPNLKYRQIDADTALIFFSQLGDSKTFKDRNFNAQIQQFTHSIQRKFAQMGGWSRDHQVMLNSFLQQRFLMANTIKQANDSIKKTKAISQKRLAQLRKQKQQNQHLTKGLMTVRDMVSGMQRQRQINKMTISTLIMSIITNIDSLLGGQRNERQVMIKADTLVMDQRMQSMIRQKDDLIVELKRRLASHSDSGHSSKIILQLQSKIKQISMQKSRLQITHGKCDDQKRRYSQQIQTLRRRIRQLQIQIQRARIVSPKQSIGTRGSINTRDEKNQTRIQISRRSDKSDTDSQVYGKSYRNYKNQDQNSNYDGQELATYRSTYQVIQGGNVKHILSGSEVSGMNLGGNFHSPTNAGRINSQNYIGGGTQSRTRQLKIGSGINGGMNQMQMSSVSVNSTSSPRNVLSSGGKKYQMMYYQTKYPQEK